MDHGPVSLLEVCASSNSKQHSDGDIEENAKSITGPVEKDTHKRMANMFLDRLMYRLHAECRAVVGWHMQRYSFAISTTGRQSDRRCCMTILRPHELYTAGNVCIHCLIVLSH
jgi:hypothetical protein